MTLLIETCEWEDISDLVASNIKKNAITIDSFLEDHIIQSNHYKIIERKNIVGYFSIYKQFKLVTFYIDEYHSHLSQQIFSEVKKYEKVANAMVPTSDEYFFSHCLDNYVNLTKQAYFSIYTDKKYNEGHFKHFEIHPVLTEDDIILLDFSEDFFSAEDLDKMRDAIDYYKAFIMKDNGKVVGCSLIEYGRVDKSIASIGMYVKPDCRQKGYARSILKSMQLKVEKEGFTPRSGCWYYNHNSKKSMESAGLYSKTRLINFQF